MADSQEPKKETVRITLPPRPTAPATESQSPGRDTVRINMPARPPGNGLAPGAAQPPNRPPPMRPPPPAGGPVARPPTARAPLPPAPSKAVPPPPSFPIKPPQSGTSPTAAAAPPLAPKITPPPPRPLSSERPMAPGPGPKKETARITVLPDPPAKPAGAVQMKKTQPLSTMPEPVTPISPIKVTPVAAPAPALRPMPVADDSISMGLCWGLLGVSALVLLIQIWNYFS